MIKKEIYAYGFLMLSALFIFVISLLASEGSANPSKEVSVYPLEKGKNYILVYANLSAKQLISLNPSIEAMSYFDEESNSTIGIVNLKGGIGKDFYLTESKSVYEIHAKRAFNLTIPK